METAIRTQADSALRSTRQLDREVREAADAASQRAITIARRSLSALERTINDVLARFSRTDFSALPDHEVVGLREQMLSEIERRAAQERELLEGIWGQLQSLTWDLDDSGHFIGTNETIEAIDEERLELRERVDLDLELTQLGLAIQVINHEFGASIRTIRENLRGLRGWAEVNPKLTPIYEGIRNSFDHLDGYLTLFTPLNRRMYRSPVDISGDDVGSFLEDLLRDRLSRHHIVLEQTARFRHKHISSYPSTFYPVFVNLVDNAIYWLASKMGDRRITLDADDDSFLIRDTGPGVRIQDRQAIFELGFTRKPGGRGLGLYIAHDVLKKAGYALSVEDSAVGAVFRIRQVQTGPLENT
jgi:signal transduction histidine kinase